MSLSCLMMQLNGVEEGDAQLGASHLPKRGRTGDNTVSVERHAQLTEAGEEEYLTFRQTFLFSRLMLWAQAVSQCLLPFVCTV